MNKIIQHEKNEERYLSSANKRIEKEDYLGALRFLFSARSINPDSLEVISSIADLYADMNALELSNKFWFIYMDKAPKEDLGRAYEELAINYFYLDNFWASSYYFHKKLDVDGFISKENLSQEVIDFFSGEEIKKTAYRIAYPFDLADYTFDTKKAKRLISIGGFAEGALALEKIPRERLDEDTAGELATCYFMNDELDKAEEICRFSLEKHGENITAFCHLSTINELREDYFNSDYYYKKALSLRKGTLSEAYKIATCAIEREDHLVVKECLETILKDRPYENAMRFFYALSLSNLGDYKSSYEQLKISYQIDPSDVAVKFFMRYVENLSNGCGDESNLTPFKYVKDIPEEIAKDWKKKIKTLIKNPEKISSALKKSEWQEILEWGIKNDDSSVMRDSAFVLSFSITPYTKKVLFETMLSPDGREELKRVLIYVTLISGIKEKFGVVAGSFYLKIRPKKLLCEKDKIFGDLYLSAYALCLSKMAFFDVESLDKIAKITDKIYKKFKGKITNAEVSNEEIAGLILSQCEFKKYSNDQSVTRIFSITLDKLKLLKDQLQGEKND